MKPSADSLADAEGLKGPERPKGLFASLLSLLSLLGLSGFIWRQRVGPVFDGDALNDVKVVCIESGNDEIVGLRSCGDQQIHVSHLFSATLQIIAQFGISF